MSGGGRRGDYGRCGAIELSAANVGTHIIRPRNLWRNLRKRLTTSKYTHSKKFYSVLGVYMTFKEVKNVD